MQMVGNARQHQRNVRKSGNIKTTARLQQCVARQQQDGKNTASHGTMTTQHQQDNELGLESQKGFGSAVLHNWCAHVHQHTIMLSIFQDFQMCVCLEKQSKDIFALLPKRHGEKHCDIKQSRICACGRHSKTRCQKSNMVSLVCFQ
jgi:hypothetical protein